MNKKYSWGIGVEHEILPIFENSIQKNSNESKKSPLMKIIKKYYKDYYKNSNMILDCNMEYEQNIITFDYHMFYYKSILSKQILYYYNTYSIKKYKKEDIIISAQLYANILYKNLTIKNIQKINNDILKPYILLLLIHYIFEKNYIVSKIFIYTKKDYNNISPNILQSFNKLLNKLQIKKQFIDFIHNHRIGSIKNSKNILKALIHLIKNKKNIAKQYYISVDNELIDKKIKFTNKYTNGYSLYTKSNDIKNFFKYHYIFSIPENIYPVFISSNKKEKNIFSKKFIKYKNYFNLFSLKYDIKDFNKYFIPLDKKTIEYAIYMEQNNIPHQDGYLIELKTLKYKNKTSSQITNELIKNEKIFLKILNSYKCFHKLNLGQIVIPKYGNYKNIFSIENNLKIIYNRYDSNIQGDIKICNLKKIKKLEKYYYSGSYHFWLTLPYTKNTTPEKFIEKHAILASFLQLLEPLFISTYFSPDYNVVGNSHEYTSGSYRDIINPYSGYGTTDISLLFGSLIHNNYVDYYPSLLSFIKNKENKHYLYNNSVIIYHKDGKIIKNYDNEIEYREASNKKIFGIKIRNYNYRNNIINIKTYLEQIQDKIKYFSENMNIYELGADIRTKGWESNIIPPLKKGWYYTHILENNKLYRIYYQLKDNKPHNIQYTPPYDYKEFDKILKNNRIGIEYRIFDNIDSKYIKDILHIFSLVMVHALKTTKITYFTTKQSWHDAIAQSIFDGYNAKPPNEYIKLLEKGFNITLPKQCNMYELYSEFVSIIYKKYKNNKYYKLLTGSNNYIPKIKNINKEVWDMIFYNKLISCKELYNNFTNLKNIYLQDKNIKMSEFKIYVNEILGKNWDNDSEKILFYIKSKY